jgi:hypothetical protein
MPGAGRDRRHLVDGFCALVGAKVGAKVHMHEAM